MVNPGIARRAGGHVRADRSRGTTTTATTVLIIAAVCLCAPAGERACASDVVRNLRPERAAAPARVEWSVAYPRTERALGEPGSAPGRAESIEVETTAERLLRRFIALHSAFRYDEALDSITRLIDIAESHPLPHYNHACVLARLHRTDAAFAALDAAVARGWRGHVHASIDPDLTILRDDDRFRELVRRMQRLAGDERIVPARVRDEPWGETKARLDARVPALLDRWHVPGVAVALVHDSTPVWTGAYGSRDVDGGTPLEADAAFRVSAPAHLLLLLTALRLEEDGRLDVPDLLLHGEEMAARHDGAVAVPRRRGRAAPARRSGLLSRAFGSAEQRRALPTATVSRQTDVRWPEVAPGGITPDLLRGAIELAGRAPAHACCEREVLEPLDLRVTTLVSSGSAPRADHAVAPCPGHSTLGTPIERGTDAARPVVRPISGPARNEQSAVTTAPELSGLIARLMPSADTAARTDAGRSPVDRVGIGSGAPKRSRHVPRDVSLDVPRDVQHMDARSTTGSVPPAQPDRDWPALAERLLELSGFELGRLGLAVHSCETADGPCLEIADVRDGSGCLARWYPKLGRGVIVLFNSQNGPDAALRIAELALSGR